MNIETATHIVQKILIKNDKIIKLLEEILSKEFEMNEKLLKSIAISLALIASCQMRDYNIPDEMKNRLNEAVGLINEVS